MQLLIITECHPVIAHLGKKGKEYEKCLLNMCQVWTIYSRNAIIAGNNAEITSISFGFLVESTTFREERKIRNYFIIKYKKKVLKKRRRTKYTNENIKILLVFCFRKMLGRFEHWHICSVFISHIGQLVYLLDRRRW